MCNWITFDLLVICLFQWSSVMIFLWNLSFFPSHCSNFDEEADQKSEPSHTKPYNYYLFKICPLNWIEKEKDCIYHSNNKHQTKWRPIKYLISCLVISHNIINSHHHKCERENMELQVSGIMKAFDDKPNNFWNWKMIAIQMCHIELILIRLSIHPQVAWWIINFLFQLRRNSRINNIIFNFDFQVCISISNCCVEWMLRYLMFDLFVIKKCWAFRNAIVGKVIWFDKWRILSFL